MTVSVQFIDGVDEEIDSVSLRQKKRSPVKSVVLLFKEVRAIERGRSFYRKIDSLTLADEEGKIRVEPTGIKFTYRGEDELAQAECTFEVASEDHWERVMRFFNRYAEAKGFTFQSTQAPEGK